MELAVCSAGFLSGHKSLSLWQSWLSFHLAKLGRWGEDKVGGSLLTCLPTQSGNSSPATTTWPVTTAIVFIILFTQAQSGGAVVKWVWLPWVPCLRVFTCEVDRAVLRCPYKPIINYFQWAKVKGMGRIENDNTEDLYGLSLMRRPSTLDIWCNLPSSDD